MTKEGEERIDRERKLFNDLQPDSPEARERDKNRSLPLTNTKFQGSSGSLAPADVMSEAEQLIKLSLVIQTTPIDKGRLRFSYTVIRELETRSRGVHCIMRSNINVNSNRAKFRQSMKRSGHAVK